MGLGGLNFSWPIYLILLSFGDFCSAQTGLFASNEPLELTLIMNVRDVIKDIGDERIYHPATLLYASEPTRDTFDIKVKTRGFMRRKQETCSFPPLMLNFKKKAVAGTIFEGQNKLKYVTHCRPVKDNLNNLFKEYLIYRQYEILTDMSVRTRLVKMTYIDEAGRKNPFDSYGIILEHKKQMAARNGATVYEGTLVHQDRCVNETLDLFTIFQYMIGNTDWSVSGPLSNANPQILIPNKKGAHNLYLIRIDSSQLTHPVPYDFDYCGLINASYAAPDPRLPITSVKQRHFRGFCRREGGYEKTIEIFNDHKEELYDVFRNFDLLDRREREASIKYFDKFYGIINGPKKVRSQIYGACPFKHEHLFN